jgi:hypothetical protein
MGDSALKSEVLEWMGHFCTERNQPEPKALSMMQRKMLTAAAAAVTDSRDCIASTAAAFLPETEPLLL